MGIVPCCWKRWWTRNAFAGFAIGLPTGSMLGRAPGADAWIGHTKVTVKPSKTSTCIWSAMLGNFYAVFPPGKQIQFNEVVLEDWLLENLNQSYVVPEDFNAYRKLKRPTAKGIFGYLHLWFHASHGRQIEKDYAELCVLLNIPVYRHVSKIRDTMGRSLNELIEVG